MRTTTGSPIPPRMGDGSSFFPPGPFRQPAIRPTGTISCAWCRPPAAPRVKSRVSSAATAASTYPAGRATAHASPMRLSNRCRRGLPIALGAAIAATLHADDATVAQGKALFSQQCASCHALAQDGIGPPLGGVTRVLTEDKLVQWIRDPAGVLATGDARAAALLRRYKVPMPSLAYLDRAQLASILAFISQQSAAQELTPFAIDAKTSPKVPRLIAPVRKTGLVVEVEDFAQIPRLPNRTPYKGITLLRPDPREDGVLLICDLMGIIYRVKVRQVSLFLDMRGIFPDFIWDPGVATGLGSLDRKSTRLNSSHRCISYAVFCLKK